MARALGQEEFSEIAAGGAEDETEMENILNGPERGRKLSMGLFQRICNLSIER